jgi:AcrR family transcriptional regulator/DNA-binding MarR family transcriptional regulator
MPSATSPSKGPAAANRRPRAAPRRPGGHVAEMQRQRLLTATLGVVAEGGVPAVTIASVSQRAGVSRRTYYELFGDREACLIAAFDHGVTRAAETVAPIVESDASWRVRVRAGLVALLGFFEENPALARLMVLEVMTVGPATIQRRARIAERLSTFIDQGRLESASQEACSPLTAEAVVGAVLSVIQTRVLEHEHPRPGASLSLLELTGQLMGVIVHPYLGAQAARKEIDMPPPAPSRRGRPRRPRDDDNSSQKAVEQDPFKGLSMRLTHRTALVLASVAQAPGASNKQIAKAAGIADEGQTSRLLVRLERYGLVENQGAQPATGEAKAWTLTPRGHGILRAVGQA